jgi:phosphoribosylpyrophosphate synthetase
MELLFAVSCMKKEGAKTVTAIIPYIPYSEYSKEGTNVV